MIDFDSSKVEPVKEESTPAPKWVETSLYILALVFVVVVLTGLAGVVHWIWTKP